MPQARSRILALVMRGVIAVRTFSRSMRAMEAVRTGGGGRVSLGT